MRRSDKTTYKAFDQEYLTELAESFNIVDFINDYVPLVKAGANYKACCPFHQEKTASFIVSKEKGLYHCFSCKKGGNIISFMMEREGMSFYEAVLFLSEKAGLTPPNTVNLKDYEEFRKTRSSLLEANSVAVELWRKNLENSEKAKTYLKDRGITQSTIDTFQIGFATDSWTDLAEELKNKG